MIRYFNILFIAFSVLLISCGEEGNNSSTCYAEFDQQTMFENMVDHIIMPAYEDLNSRIIGLSESANEFVSAPNTASLEILKEHFEQTYMKWQTAAQYEFGPAEEVFLRASLNSFPLDVTATLNRIDTEDYNFDQPDTFDKGLPAIDYLLYQTDSENTILQFTNDESYGNFLLAIISDIQMRVSTTLDKWNSEYRSFFVDNTGTAAGSSLSLIINGLNENYELIKREKLGVPAGVLTLGFTNPDKVEAYYSGLSLPLIQASLAASQALYLGKGNNGVDGVGLDDYLSITNAQKNEQALGEVIKNYYTDAINTVNALGNSQSLSTIIENNNSEAENAYNEVVKQLINIKTDMPSVLCVSITYIDNPSDND